MRPPELVDAYTNPRQYIRNSYRNGVCTAPIWSMRERACCPLDDTLQHVYDPYAFVRDAYLQRRAYLVSDGKVTDEEPLVDPDADNPDQAAPAKPAS